MLATRNRNPLSTDVKQKVGDILLPLVYTATDLKSHVKLAHWNLRDPDFISIHRLLDEVAAKVEKGIDEVAERARQLGKIMDVTPTRVGEMTTLKPFPKGLLNRTTACDALLRSLNGTVDGLHKAIDECDEIGDAISADLLTKVSGELEVFLWLIESHMV